MVGLYNTYYRFGSSGKKTEALDFTLIDLPRRDVGKSPRHERYSKHFNKNMYTYLRNKWQVT